MRGLLSVLAIAWCGVGVSSLDVSRDGRWFFGGGTVTRVVVETRVVTEVVPSSCVQVEASLLPCREMREFTIEPTSTLGVSPTASSALLLEEDGKRDLRLWDSTLYPESTIELYQRQPDDSGSKPTPQPVRPLPGPEVEAKPSDGGSWSFNDLFSGFYSTVTQTVVQDKTRRFRDKAHVVTFSVVGCLPSRLPFDLEICAPGEARVPTSPSPVPGAAPSIAAIDPR